MNKSKTDQTGRKNNRKTGSEIERHVGQGRKNMRQLVKNLYIRVKRLNESETGSYILSHNMRVRQGIKDKESETGKNKRGGRRVRQALKYRDIMRVRQRGNKSKKEGETGSGVRKTDRE